MKAFVLIFTGDKGRWLQRFVFLFRAPFKGPGPSGVISGQLKCKRASPKPPNWSRFWGRPVEKMMVLSDFWELCESPQHRIDPTRPLEAIARDVKVSLGRLVPHKSPQQKYTAPPRGGCIFITPLGPGPLIVVVKCSDCDEVQSTAQHHSKQKKAMARN